MVRDLMIDMQERDLLFEDRSDVSLPIFDSIWGNLFDEDEENEILICNIIIPEAYWSLVSFVGDELLLRFKSSYVPDTRNFRIRAVALKDGLYSLFENIRGDYGASAYSYALSKNVAATISASILPYIDIDGQYLVRFVQNRMSEALDKAYVYSAKSSDIEVNFSDDQASQLLTLCAPGKSYRFPTTGVGVTSYLNRVIGHTDLQKVLEEQFEGDKKPIHSATFDNSTCRLDVMCSPEKEELDLNLDDMSRLNVNFFDMFTDEYVRRNVVLTEVGEIDFIGLLDNYDRVLEILLFTDDKIGMHRIADQVITGRFDGEGNVIEDEDYLIVTATLEANTIVMFDDEAEDLMAQFPVFLINDVDESRLYTSLVEQPYWLTENCHKCMVLKKRATLRYVIAKNNFREGKGLFIVEQTSANIKNMVGLIQDVNTGRLLGLVSNSTNINDMTLDEITQHIYATQITN